jgi:hypothetical protein
MNLSGIKKIIAGLIKPAAGAFLVVSLLLGFTSNASAESIYYGESLKTGDTISLQGDTGKYVSRINRGSADPAEVAKESIDPYSQFKVTVLEGGKIALQSDTGKYLSRINRGSTNPVEAAKDSIDPYSQFKVTVFDGGRIALQADNGKYLSRINRDGGANKYNPLEAAKDNNDPPFTLFKIVKN